MLSLNPLAIAASITAICCLSVTVIFLIYGKNLLHRIWAIFHFVVAGWATFVALAVSTSNPDAAYQFWLFSHSLGIYVSIFFFHSIALFCQLKIKILVILSYVYGLVFNFFNYYDNGALLYGGTNYLFNIYYLDANNSAFLFSLSPWFFLAIYGNYKLYQYYAHSPTENKHASFLLVSVIIGYCGGVSTFLPMLGFHNFYPLTIIGVAIFGIINTYAIFRHQILELRIILKRSLIYSILLAFISISYLLSVVFLEKFFQVTFGYQSVTISIGTAFVLGILIIPLRNHIHRIVDKVLFHGTQEEIAQENVRLRKEVEQSEKLKAVATLASGMAHEIKNPLTAVKTFSEYLPQKMEDKEFLQKFSRLVGSEVDRIDRIVKELLDFAKPSTPELKPTAITQLIDDTLELVSNNFVRYRINVEKNFTTNGCLIKVDSHQIKQVLLNLFMNAADAMRDNGGELRVNTQIDKNTNQFYLTVEDTGVGITKQDLKHIFDPFFTKKDGGTGLGLAICQGIVAEHGGEISVRSTPGKGTKFIVVLPVNSKIKK